MTPQNQQFSFTPEKLDKLAEDVDPTVLWGLLEEYEANNGQTPGQPLSQYGSVLEPQAGPAAVKKPMLTPQMLQMLQPKAPGVLPAAGLTPNPGMGKMAQFQGAPAQPGYSQILRSR